MRCAPLFAFMLLLIGAPAAAEGTTPVSPVILLDYGVVCDVQIGAREEAPLTESGQINLIDQGIEIDVTTAQVPARKGLSFGIRVTLQEGMQLADARVVVEHPPIGAASVTVQSWSTLISPGDTNVNLFTFEHDYEMAQGRWTFQIVGAQGVALRQSFDIVGPFAVPQVQDRCFPAQITS